MIASVQSTPHNKITLREARLFQGFTLKEAAQKVRVSTSALSKYERCPGETPLHVAVELIQLYQVPLNHILWQV